MAQFVCNYVFVQRRLNGIFRATIRFIAPILKLHSLLNAYYVNHDNMCPPC